MLPLTFCALALAVMPSVYAQSFPITVNCSQPIPSGVVSPQDIQDFFLQMTQNGASNTIQDLCINDLQGTPPLSVDIQGFGISGNAISGVQNDNATCEDALVAILEQCILGKNMFGGTAQEGAQIYEITNLLFPLSPLISPGESVSIPPPPPAPTPVIDCNTFFPDQINNGEVWDLLGTTDVLQGILNQGPFSNDPASMNRIDLVAASMFGAIPDFRCGLQESGCNPITCEQAGNSPQGAMILNSFANLHLTLLNANTGLGNAAAGFDPNTILDTVTNPPPSSADDILKTVIDVLTGLAGIANAGIGYIAGTTKFVGANTGKAIDKSSSAVTSIISAGNAVVKDNLPSSNPAGDATQVQSLFSAALMDLQNTLGDFATDLLTEGVVTSNNVPAYATSLANNGQISVSVVDVFDSGVMLTPQANSKDIPFFQSYFDLIINAQVINSFWNDVLEPEVQGGWFSEIHFVPPGDSRATGSFNGVSFFLDQMGTDIPQINNKAFDGSAFGGLTIDMIGASAIQCLQLQALEQRNGMSLTATAEQNAFAFDGSGDSSGFPFTNNVTTPCFITMTGGFETKDFPAAAQMLQLNM